MTAYLVRRVLYAIRLLIGRENLLNGSSPSMRSEFWLVISGRTTWQRSRSAGRSVSARVSRAEGGNRSAATDKPDFFNADASGVHKVTKHHLFLKKSVTAVLVRFSATRGWPGHCARNPRGVNVCRAGKSRCLCLSSGW